MLDVLKDIDKNQFILKCVLCDIYVNMNIIFYYIVVIFKYLCFVEEINLDS